MNMNKQPQQTSPHPAVAGMRFRQQTHDALFADQIFLLQDHHRIVRHLAASHLGSVRCQLRELVLLQVHCCQPFVSVMQLAHYYQLFVFVMQLARPWLKLELRRSGFVDLGLGLDVFGFWLLRMRMLRLERWLILVLRSLMLRSLMLRSLMLQRCYCYKGVRCGLQDRAK